MLSKIGKMKKDKYYIFFLICRINTQKMNCIGIKWGDFVVVTGGRGTVKGEGKGRDEYN
jgi:formylmethanofuran dehydrogenase subunit D